MWRPYNSRMLLLTASVYMHHEAWASFSKFSYRYRDKSALANIGGYMRAFRWGGYGLAFGGDFVVWFGYDVGPIQLDPIYADYYAWLGAFREFAKGVGYLFLEHTCFHYIDRLDTLPLYWNAIRLLYRERDAEVSLTQYLYDPRYKFLSQGADWGTAFSAFRRFRRPLKGDMAAFLDVSLTVAAARDYRRVRGSLKLEGGIEFRSGEGDLTAGLGYRPYDRMGTIRDAEGVPYVFLRARGF